MKLLALTALTLAAFAQTTFAAPAQAPKAKVKAAALVCPITGEKIISASAAAAHETYKGKTYYFCCPSCKPMFDKNPGKAVANAAKGKYGTM
jgi:YHS domain-containing protein